VDHSAIALILISTFLHAGWNLLARAGRKEHAFLLQTLCAIVVLGLVPAVIGLVRLPPFPARTRVCAIVSGCFCGVYYLGLARAYGAGDFTVVYPLARALPVLFVSIGDVARGRPPSPLGWVGMALVAGGCLCVPMRSLRDFSVKRYFTRTTAWALVTASATVGYTLVDKFAAEAAHGDPSYAAVYGYVFFCVSALVYGLCLSALRRRGREWQRVGWGLPVLAGALNFGAYWLVLWAYQLAQRASYVVAFRQFSIVVGVVLAFVWFREKGAAVRIAAACVIVLGLVLIAAGG